MLHTKHERRCATQRYLNKDLYMQFILSPSVIGFNLFSKVWILKAGLTNFSEISSSHLIILDDTRMEEASFVPRTHKYYSLQSKISVAMPAWRPGFSRRCFYVKFLLGMETQPMYQDFKSKNFSLFKKLLKSSGLTSQWTRSASVIRIPNI